MLKKKILVVDDEPFFVEVLTTNLVAAGYVVCSAQNGEEAISKAKSAKPHLIIMDVMMPRMSGYEAMQRIRQNSETRNIPAIIVSAKAGMRDFFDGISRVEFMQKPFNIRLLCDKIEAAIGSPLGNEGQPRHAVLAGVEELTVNKIRDFLTEHNFQVLVVLNEDETIKLSEKFCPDIILCQFWEDESILDPRKIAKKLLLHPETSGTPFYVYCKAVLSVEAMKYFKPERIIAYKENSDLLRKLEALAFPSPHLPIP